MFATPRATVNSQSIRTTPSGVILWPVHEIRACATADPRALANYLQELESEIAHWHKHFIHAASEAAQLRAQISQGNRVPNGNLQSWDEDVYARDTEIWRLGERLRALEQQIAKQKQYIVQLEQLCRAPQVPTATVKTMSDSSTMSVLSGDRESSCWSPDSQSDKAD